MLLGEGLIVVGASYPHPPNGVEDGNFWKILKSTGYDLVFNRKKAAFVETKVSPLLKDELVHNPLAEAKVSEELDTVVNTPQRNTAKRKIFNALRILLLFIVFSGVTTFIGLLIWSDSVQTTSVKVISWLGELPILASSGILALIYCLCLLVFCPGTPFNLAAGFLYGMWWGFGVAVVGCSLGATMAFILGRTIAREWIKNKMEDKPKFKAIDWALRKNGIYIVFLTRLSPLFPFPLLNYAFGITKIASWQYVVGTILGSAPGTFAYCYVGTLMRDLADMWTSQDNERSMIWFGTGTIVTLISIVVISILTQRAISRATEEYELLNSSPKDEDEVIIELETVSSQGEPVESS